MFEPFVDYHEARAAAQAKANRLRCDVTLWAVREYGQPRYVVALAHRNDSDYARAEIIRPEDTP